MGLFRENGNGSAMKEQMSRTLVLWPADEDLPLLP